MEKDCRSEAGGIQIPSQLIVCGFKEGNACNSSMLQSIFDEYGDIAANCRLESVSTRAYYLECLCSVVQELQSTSLMQMTKAKVKEMLAVLKDVETAQIDVDWLRDILSEVSEAIDVVTQHQTIEAAKVNCVVDEIKGGCNW
ncbi:hypothetical protein Ddye_004177 [Dipteronia dyeriana]|uniref:Uncharacterized protein n=1 Tax=Dipteronia dyeriana TaxID=168575 RepID=A0AAD9XV77_9ROSI|nr:hypothetical protein Ddye_004177 [Dipteronia dyeriana]